MTTVAELEQAALSISALIQKARREGISREEHERLTERGLTDEQKRVASERAGEGRIRLTGQRPQTDDGGVEIPTLLDNLKKQKKTPWIFTLDGVDFPVKSSYGAKKRRHSEWWWKEDGFRFRFLKARTDDAVHSVIIEEVE